MSVDTRAGKAREKARQQKNLYKRRALDAEAANAALAVALRGELVRHVQDGHWGTVTEPKPETCGRCASLVAALSDTGEDWPKVREQVLKTGRALLDWIGRSPLEPFEGDRVLHSMGLEEDFRAALAALEVK